MLNKLSFNLMNELNEADTNACEIKRQVFMESDKVTIKNKVEEAAPVSTNQQIIDAKKDSADKGLYTEERKDKEERLASLKTQLEKDKDQLAADEIEAIEKEIADLEAELFEKEKLNETGEWDDNDDEMKIWKEELRDKAEYIANEIHGSVTSVSGFDKYQGPVAIISTPIHGDVQLWFDNEDDTGLSLLCKIARVGWIQGGANDISDILSKEVIPEDEIINESEKLDNQILNEEIPEGTAALEKLKHGDVVYVRNSDGLPLLMQYADSYPEPEDYDEGYTTGWERGADEEFDKVQDEKFAAAKEASEDREVWEVLEIDETTIEPNGTVYGYLYGEEELIDFLNQVRIVNVRKTLEEDQIEDTRKDSIEKGLLSESEFNVGDTVKVPYKYGAYTPGEYTEAPIIDISEGRYVTVEIPSKLEVTMDQLKKWNTLGECDEPLKESYSDKLGGDPEDFVTDVETIKAKLSEIDTSGFGSHLAVQMVEDWIETCDYQIEKGKRLASGNEFYTEADDRTYKDRDEAEYYRNKELYANSGLERHKEAMEKAKKACEEKGIKLDESVIDNLKMKHHAKKAGKLSAQGLNGKGTEESNDQYKKHFKAAHDIAKTIQNKEAKKADKILDKANKISKKADKHIAKANSISTKVDQEYDKAFKDEESKIKLESEEVKPIAEAEVKGLKTVKSQGNIFMLEDETNKFIVGENYNESEGLIENAEIYDNKGAADKDYLDRCEITGGQKEIKESVEEHDLSKDMLGDEASKRASNDQRAYEKYLALAKEIKDGKNDTITLDSAKQLLKNAYVKAKGYYSFEPEEIDRRIAKDIPELFSVSENYNESEEVKTENREIKTTTFTPKQFREYFEDHESISTESWGEIKQFVICQLNDDNFDFTTVPGKALKAQLEDEGKYNYWTSLYTDKNKPYSILGLPIYGDTERYVTKWFTADKQKQVEDAIRNNRNSGILERIVLDESKEEADKDYLGRRDIKKDGEKFEEGAISDMKLKHYADKAAKSINDYQNDKTPEKKEKADKDLKKSDDYSAKLINKSIKKADKKTKKLKDKIDKVEDKEKEARNHIDNLSRKRMIDKITYKK